MFPSDAAAHAELQSSLLLGSCHGPALISARIELSLSSLHPAALDATQPAPPETALPAWKNEVSARVRAHRTRRGSNPENQPALPGMESAAAASSIAARVAERYSRVPSYKDMLAAQAAAAAQAAEAAAAAARAAHAAAAAVHASAAVTQEMALELEIHSDIVEPEPEPCQLDLLRYSVSADSLPRPRATPVQAHAEYTRRQGEPFAEAAVLEDAVVEPDKPLPARVIEFPRELVAPRKARPRLAEGPLLDPAAPDPAAAAASEAVSAADEAAQLRIFEADPELAAPVDAAPETTGAETSGWLSIRLDAEKPPARQSRPAAPAALADELPLHVASIADRGMAAIVDVALTLAAFLVFVLVFALCTTHPPTGRIAVAGAVASLGAMWVLYQFLFFSLSAATPGMLYAKIALCTFDDENPDRRQLRLRIPAMLLAALPLGIGFLWILFDEDSLGWHDRINQTYQRSYREM